MKLVPPLDPAGPRGCASRFFGSLFCALLKTFVEKARHPKGCIHQTLVRVASLGLRPPTGEHERVFPKMKLNEKRMSCHFEGDHISARTRLSASLASSWPVACSVARFALPLRVPCLLALAACLRLLRHEQRCDLRRQAPQLPPRPVAQESAQPTPPHAELQATGLQAHACPSSARQTALREPTGDARKYHAGPLAASGHRTEPMLCIKIVIDRRLRPGSSATNFASSRNPLHPTTH